MALNAVASILIRGKQENILPQIKEETQCDDRGRDWSDVAKSQGMPADTRNRKMQGTDFLLEPPGECSPADTLILGPVKSIWIVRE